MKSRKEIILELTPLLDVILIMMFYILMQNSFASQKEQEAAKEQVAQIQESAAADIESMSDEYAAKESSISDELAAAEARLEGQQSFEGYAVISEIVIVQGENGKRNLHVIHGEEDEIISYDWDSMKYAENALRAAVDKLIAQASAERPVFIVFKYSDEEIYRRDFELVQGILSSGTRSNVYVNFIGGN